MRKLRKASFALPFFFAEANYHFADANREKTILRWHFFAETKESELQGLIKHIPHILKDHLRKKIAEGSN